MIAIGLIALGAIALSCIVAGGSGLLRTETKNVSGLPRRATRSAPVSARDYVSKHKWGIGLLAMFGISGLAIGVVSNLAPAGDPVVIDDDDPDIEWPDLGTSGSNPNLTRVGYPVRLNSFALSALFDPATRGSNSIWGLCGLILNRFGIAPYSPK